jgi:exopolyphosphatase/guanosine-5'-triphosphate,3'-diphosphate pyrophosphatase
MNLSKPRLAAVDIGTNSFHLVIVEADTATGKFKILGREKENVRLGTGSTDMKYLSEEAMQRGIETLKRFKSLADSADAPLRAIATSAVREAKNQNEFIKRVKEFTGIKIEIASGVEEARYIYLGVLQALPVFNKRILLIDIGGGSTEFLIGEHRDIIYDNSLKLGAMRITQRFFGDKEIDSKQVKECRKYIKGTMNTVTRALKRYPFETVVGSSGTINNIANIIKTKRGESAEAPINNFTFTKDELKDVMEELLEAKTIKQRAKIPGLDPARADIIVGGALIVEQIFKELDIKELTVSEYALREGIVYDTMEKKYMSKKAGHLDDIRYKSVLHIAENFKIEKEHAMSVTAMALKIFDQTVKIHSLGAAEREYLEAAAILHEVGCFVSHSQHHRHSYYLIRNSELLGYTENEKEIIANVARYHRKSHPKMKHPDYAKLSAEDQIIVKKLAGILRVADGLDRTHNSTIKDLVCTRNNGTLDILLKANKSKPLEMEIWAAEQKKQLFEEMFGLELKFEAK